VRDVRRRLHRDVRDREIGLPGTEVLYPQPFGIITAASEKEYPLDLSHFSIMGTAAGAWGVEADSDKATFEKVTIETRIGRDKGIRLKVPFVISGMGSTNVAKQNWEGLAGGAAISGSVLTIGENVCGMDEGSEIKNGKIIRSPDMEFRVKSFTDWQDKGYGAVVVQANIEDTRLGVQEYAINKLGVEVVELKWGQGAKDIGGEVKIKSLKKAKELKRRGYIVLPDPRTPTSSRPSKRGASRSSSATPDGHGRGGIVHGARRPAPEGRGQVHLPQDGRLPSGRPGPGGQVRLKGQARPADRGRSRGRHGHEPLADDERVGHPSVEIWSLTWKYADQLAKAKQFVPDIALAGGITFEDQIFKALSLGAPYVKAVGMARSPMAAAMVGKTIGSRIKDGQIPVYVERFGGSAEEIFVTAPSSSGATRSASTTCRPGPWACTRTSRGSTRACASSWPAPASSPCSTSRGTTSRP